MRKFLVSVLFAPLVLFLSSTPAIAQTTWYVDDDNAAGPWEGSQANPFQLIQDGINAAVDGDTVLVLPGTYLENIDFLGKAITVRSDGDGDSDNNSVVPRKKNL